MKAEKPDSEGTKASFPVIKFPYKSIGNLFIKKGETCFYSKSFPICSFQNFMFKNEINTVTENYDLV